MPSGTLKSLAPIYWATWLIAVLAFASFSFIYSPASSAGWFSLFSAILGGSVFNFEFGRLVGFLRSHCPEQYARLPKSVVFRALAFFHPALLRPCWAVTRTTSDQYSHAILVYRSAWLFSLISIFSVLPLAWCIY